MRKYVLYGALAGTFAIALGLEAIVTRLPQNPPPDRLVLVVGGDGVPIIPEEPPAPRSSLPRDTNLSRGQRRSPLPTASARTRPENDRYDEPARDSAAPRTHRVRAGDTLTSIALEHLGSTDRWQEIQELNRLSDPRKIREGTLLQLPAR